MISIAKEETLVKDIKVFFLCLATDRVGVEKLG
jgi:hypothetical protein